MLQWTVECRYLFQIVILFLSDVYPEVELLDCMVVLFLIFWGTSILFSIVAAPIYIFTISVQGFPSLYIRISTCYFLCSWWFLYPPKPAPKLGQPPAYNYCGKVKLWSLWLLEFKRNLDINFHGKNLQASGWVIGTGIQWYSHEARERRKRCDTQRRAYMILISSISKLKFSCIVFRVISFCGVIVILCTKQKFRKHGHEERKS